MDDRFPKWLRTVVNKLDFLGLPNLPMLICGLAVLGFIGKTMMGAPIDRFIFDPELVKQGEWWRLFAYPVSEGLSNPLWLVFYVLYIYFVMGALESQWGAGPLTVFTGLSYVCTIIGAMLVNKPAQIWFYVLENVSLAFGTLFPNLELYLFFILPVKAKWLAMLAGALLVGQFLMGSWETKIFLLWALFPYLLFFSPMLLDQARTSWRVSQKRKRFDEDMWR